MTAPAPPGVDRVSERLPTSRWRTVPTAGARGAVDRVRLAHAQARTTVRLALALAASALVAAAAADGRWLPLHLFLAGGVVLAISGVSVMLTVTWSAAPAPPDRLVQLQRACVATGAAGVAAGRQLELAGWIPAAAGGTYLSGLLLLAAVLAGTTRRGVERRFDPAVAAYLAATAAGIVGVAIGVAMAVDGPTPHLRAAHVTLNVLGLVGLVVGGTLPFFAATVGRSRMATRATAPRLFGTVAWQVLALIIATIGLATGTTAAASAGLGAYAFGIGATLGMLPRPTRRQLRWAGPRLVALWTGALWWAGSVVAIAVDVGRGGAVLGDRWLMVLVVGGYAQILWGSLAYLLPMLRGGGHERLGAGFATTRSWIGLSAANLAAVALALGAPAAAAACIGAWALDAGARAVRVVLGGRARPAKGGAT
jgi:nitrite reductase (NO-forming)